jgi:hypothetical protein
LKSTGKESTASGLRCIWFACLWSILKARNAKIFQNKTISVAYFFFCIPCRLLLEGAWVFFVSWLESFGNSVTSQTMCPFWLQRESLIISWSVPSWCRCLFVSQAEILSLLGGSTCLSSAKSGCLIHSWVDILIMTVLN